VRVVTVFGIGIGQKVRAHTAIERLPAFVSVIVPVGKGLHIAYRHKAT